MQLDLFEEDDDLTSLKKSYQLLQKEFKKAHRSHKLQLQQVMKMYLELQENFARLSSQFSAFRREMPANKANSNSDLLEKLFAEAYERSM